jgi:hypothetical protein
MFHQLMLARIGGDEVAVLAVGGGLLIAVISIVTSAVYRTTVARQREQSRREIAAYVAEGSMSADDAAKLMADDTSGWCGWKGKHSA